MQLDHEQSVAADFLIEERLKRDYVTLGGYAGTGKTTLIKHLLDRLPESAVVAFTGKAADVLRKKGVPASTIHSLLYMLRVDEETGKPILDDHGQLQWDKRDLGPVDTIIIDEGSMVPDWIFNDLVATGKNLIFIGDHGQLPPVGGNKDFCIMNDPDITLEKIHRNAGEIAHFAHFLRQGGEPKDWPKVRELHDTPKVHIFPEGEPAEWKVFDQIICGFNNTRHQINAMVREELDLHGRHFLPGERMIVLQNNRKLRVFNGMQGIVTKTKNNRIDFKVDDENHRYVFYSPRSPEKKTPRTVAIGWAYCITCHKAQGDEYNDVCVIEEQCDYWEPARWNYTAASRAKENLVWLP